MRGHFSIEWMAQSSQSETPRTSEPTGTPSTLVCGPSASNPESLPGFYWKPQLLPQQGNHEAMDGFNEGNMQLQDGGKSQASESSLSSLSSGVDSDYDSEGARSVSPSQKPSSPSAASPQCGRRSRTAFTADQIRCLEKSFKRNAYLGTQDKAELCRKLHLSDKQVRNWFQNRRMKMKRSMQDALAQACQANTTSQFMLYSDLQAYRARTYHGYPSVVAPEGPAATAAPYASPNGLQYSSPLPMDSFCQYSNFPGVMLPSAPSHYRAPYSNYPQYY
ncbi:unnamed protein product [Ophioblennius macclurei]